MTTHLASGKLSRSLRRALVMCSYQHARMRSGAKPRTVTALARQYGCDPRTIHRWIATATEAGVLQLKRTGRLPKWHVNRERIDTLRADAKGCYGRRMEGRLSEHARNTRWGYKQALFAHYLPQSETASGTPKGADLTFLPPHTPIVSNPTGNPQSIRSFNPPIPLSSQPVLTSRAHAKAQLGPQSLAASVLLRLAAQVGPEQARMAAKAVAQSGLIRDATGAPLRGNEARRLLGHQPRCRANGSDSERSATVLRKGGA